MQGKMKIINGFSGGNAGNTAVFSARSGPHATCRFVHPLSGFRGPFGRRSPRADRLGGRILGGRGGETESMIRAPGRIGPGDPLEYGEATIDVGVATASDDRRRGDLARVVHA